MIGLEIQKTHVAMCCMYSYAFLLECNNFMQITFIPLNINGKIKKKDPTILRQVKQQKFQYSTFNGVA